MLVAAGIVGPQPSSSRRTPPSGPNSCSSTAVGLLRASLRLADALSAIVCDMERDESSGSMLVSPLTRGVVGKRAGEEVDVVMPDAA